jgi:hypothetical protein
MATPFPRPPPPTFLQPWSLLRKALIRAAKTSPTAGTLCAIGFEFVLKIIEKNKRNEKIKKQNIQNKYIENNP